MRGRQNCRWEIKPQTKKHCEKNTASYLTFLLWVTEVSGCHIFYICGDLFKGYDKFKRPLPSSFEEKIWTQMKWKSMRVWVCMLWTLGGFFFPLILIKLVFRRFFQFLMYLCWMMYFCHQPCHSVLNHVAHSNVFFAKVFQVCGICCKSKRSYNE